MKIKKIILSAALLALVSCSGFLDEEHATSFSEESVYSTEYALEAQMYGCYDAMHSLNLWKGTMSEFLHTGSGLLIWAGQRATDEWQSGAFFAKYSTCTYANSNIWSALYNAIFRCNCLLDHLPDSPVEESYKTELAAEARLLRAISYFTAVRLWGDVPLILTAATSQKEVTNPRTNFVKVYEQIIDDLTFAEQYMRDSRRAEEAQPGRGRPNRMAATAFKASVYLTIGSLLGSPDDNFWDNSKPGRTPDFSALGITSARDAYSLAYETSESVINGGVYSLASDFRQLFRWTEPEDWMLPERIICLESSNKAGGNYNSLRMLPHYPEGTVNTSTRNSNTGRVRPSRFMLDNIIRLSGGSKGKDPDNADIYVSTTDPRLNATYLITYTNINKNKKIKTYPLTGNVDSDASDVYLPFFRKYLDPTYDASSGKADFYLMRLAEQYLISAEAAAALSQTPGDEWWEKAVSRINDIRRRARQSTDGAEATMPVDLKSDDCKTSEELVNMVFWERCMEMAGEGHEWFDTHRKGARWLSETIARPANRFYMDNPYMTKYWKFTFAGADQRGYIYHEDVNDLRKSLLVALPQSELIYNTEITEQNDFFWK